MSPLVLISMVLAALVGGWFFMQRVQAKQALAKFVLIVLDALVVGYVVYLGINLLLDLSAFTTWEGWGRILLFFGFMSSWQKLGLLLGGCAALSRFWQGPGQDDKDKRVYRKGTLLRGHNTALRIANVILADRADKAGIPRPRHCDPDAHYDLPEDPAVLDDVEPVSDPVTNQALQPYVSGRHELNTVFMGMLRVPADIAKTHLLVVGATGSGKTLMIHSLMKSVLPRLATDHSIKAFIYDDKPDFLPFAAQLGITDRILNFDSFDANGGAWDIASDVTSMADAQEVASALVPRDKDEKQPFFPESVESLVYAVLIVLMEQTKKLKTKWTLRDVLLAFRDINTLRTVLSLHPEGLRRIDRVFGNQETLQNIMATVDTKLRPLTVVAALWSRVPTDRWHGVRSWMEKGGVFLITGRSNFTKALLPVNRALFRMVSLRLLSQPDSETQETWVFLDEIREIGKLEGLRSLANKGRSKGVRMVLAFQTLDGMRAEHGVNQADEIASLCVNKIFLRNDSDQTNSWATKLMGNLEVDETIFNHSRSNSTARDHSGHKTDTLSHQRSWSTKRESRAAIGPEHFREQLKPVGFEYGFQAINMIPLIGTYSSNVPWEWVDLHLPKAKPLIESLRPSEDQTLVDWDAVDLQRLGLPLELLNGRPSGVNKSATSNDLGVSKTAKHKALWNT